MTKRASWAKHHMRENRNNQFRPEQIDLYKILRDQRRNSDIIMEHMVIVDKTIIAVLDIADLTRKEAFRLNGKIHASHILKDEKQKVRLEELGWKVIDYDT